jgi:hypothetical protein
VPDQTPTDETPDEEPRPWEGLTFDEYPHGVVAVPVEPTPPVPVEPRAAEAPRHTSPPVEADPEHAAVDAATWRAWEGELRARRRLPRLTVPWSWLALSPAGLGLVLALAAALRAPERGGALLVVAAASVVLVYVAAYLVAIRHTELEPLELFSPDPRLWSAHLAGVPVVALLGSLWHLGSGWSDALFTLGANLFVVGALAAGTLGATTATLDAVAGPALNVAWLRLRAALRATVWLLVMLAGTLVLSRDAMPDGGLPGSVLAGAYAGVALVIALLTRPREHQPGPSLVSGSPRARAPRVGDLYFANVPRLDQSGMDKDRIVLVDAVEGDRVRVFLTGDDHNRPEGAISALLFVPGARTTNWVEVARRRELRRSALRAYTGKTLSSYELSMYRRNADKRGGQVIDCTWM